METDSEMHVERVSKLYYDRAELATFWVRTAASGTYAILMQLPSPYFYTDKLLLSGVWKALELGCQGVCLTEDGIWIPRKVEPSDVDPKFHGLTSPDPAYAVLESDSSMIWSIPLFSWRAHLFLYSIGAELYVYKQCTEHDLEIHQNELDNYHLLRDSTVILPIRGLVCRPYTCILLDHPHASVDDFIAIDGFLIPFVGAHSRLFYTGEWSSSEKEALAVALIDAVLVAEHRGVHLSDLKGENVLLTVDGLKLIDIHDCIITPGYSMRTIGSSPAEINWKSVVNLGKAIAELFVERVPTDMYTGLTLFDGATEPFVELISRCCEIKEFHSVQQMYDATRDLLQPIRSRGVSIPALAEKRAKRIRLQTDSYDEWYLGRRQDDICKPWVPSFGAESVSITSLTHCFIHNPDEFLQVKPVQ